MQGFKSDYNENTLDNINKQIKSLQRRIEGLYLDKLDGKISEESWEQKNNEWQAEKEKLGNQIHAMNNADKTFYEGSNLLLNFCKEAPRLYKSKSIKIKKQILSLLGSNFLYKDGKLSIELNSVFYNLLEIQKSTKNSIDWVRLSGQSLRILIFSDMEVTGSLIPPVQSKIAALRKLRLLRNGGHI